MVKKKIDALGRIGIPKNFRDAMNLNPDDFLLMDYDSKNKQIVLKKATENCAVCGKTENLLKLKNGIPLCQNCFEKLKK